MSACQLNLIVSATGLLALLTSILNLSVTKTVILPFGACYVIMHKVYSECDKKCIELRDKNRLCNRG